MFFFEVDYIFFVLGLDLTEHRSRNIDMVQKIQNAHFIFCMTEKHRYLLLQFEPSLVNRSATLIEGEDILDPFGENLDVFKSKFFFTPRNSKISWVMALLFSLRSINF